MRKLRKLKRGQFKDFLFVIQARLNSKRLPNKILLPFKGQSIIEFLYNKIKKEFNKSKIIIAIPETKKNIYLRKYLQITNLKYITGSETDLVLRYKKACENINSKYIVRLTSDNPFINIQLIKYCLKSHVNSKKKFSSTRKIFKKKIFRYFPKGHSVDIINKKDLMNINNNKLTNYEKEHMIPYFFKKFEFNLIKNDSLKRKLNLKAQSVDTFKDYLKILDL